MSGAMSLSCAQAAAAGRLECALASGAPSVRLSALRAKIAKIAVQGPDLSSGFPGQGGPVPLGSRGLDRLLGGGLKRGTLTEIVAARPGDAAAASGFLLGLATRFAARPDKAKAAIIWIFEDFTACEQGALYGPGLALNGLDPARFVLVAAPSAKEALWAMEEALKCRTLAVVIGEIWSAKPYDLLASRRLLLAAQKHGTPALIFLAGLPGGADQLSSGADLRFEIRAQPSVHPPSTNFLPLPGPPAWQVRIAKARIRARAGPQSAGIDRDRFHAVVFDPEEALFRDALPLALAPRARHRSDRPALAQG